MAVITPTPQGWILILALSLGLLLILIGLFGPKTPAPVPPPPIPPPPVPPPPSPPSPPTTPRTVVFRHTSLVTDAEVAAYITAQQAQLDLSFAPHYGPAQIIASTPGFVLSATDWPVYLLDVSDVAGALAYHDIDPAGRPYAKVFVQTCEGAGVSWQSACSHEILEIIPDPPTTRTAIGPNGRPWAYETADPVETSFDPTPKIGMPLSNFVFPSWFDVDGKAPYDAGGILTAPFSVAPGGYAQFMAEDGHWVTIQGYLATGRNRL